MEQKTNYEISELINFVSESTDAQESLLKQFEPMIYSEINKVKKSAYALGIEHQDLKQEAYLAFIYAINNYDEALGVKFITFATLCVRRKILNFISKHSSTKSMILKYAAKIDDTDQYNRPYTEVLKSNSNREPLNVIMTDESLMEVKCKFNELSPLEKQVLIYDLNDIKVNEMATILNKKPKQIYYYLANARKKLKLNK